MDLGNDEQLIYVGNWQFNKISLNDIDIYNSYIKETLYPVCLWSGNFAYSWSISQSKSRKVLWKIVDDLLVTFVYVNEQRLYLQYLPFGKADADKIVEVLIKCMNYCKQWNEKFGFKTKVNLINELQLAFLRESKDFSKCFRIVNLVGLEKHYSINKLITIQGKEFEYVRRKLNKLQRTYPDLLLRKYETKDYQALLDLNKKWKVTASKKYSSTIDNVYYIQMIKNFNHLNLNIIVAELKGEVVGMTCGGILPNGQSWCSLRKGLNHIDGLTEYLILGLIKLIHNLDSGVVLMNDGSDLGYKGLRFLKEKFRPVLNLKRYIIFMK